MTSRAEVGALASALKSPKPSRVPVGRKFNSLADMDAMNADTPETQETPEIKNRLVSLGHMSATTRKKPLLELNAKGKLLVEFMVEGCRHDWITRYSRPAPTGEDPDRRVPIEPGQPLSLIEAADALRIRRRNARWIASQFVFQRELAKALQAFREGHKAEALRTVVGVMREKGEGTAADRKVSLQAASMILGEAVGPAPTKPSVNVNVGVQLAPGVVIRLPAGLPQTPLERQAIEAQANPEDER